MIMLLEPPPQYDHPYRGPVIEQRLSEMQMLLLCHGPTPACSWVTKTGVCHIALPANERDGRAIALMRRHETGHCNGWPGHHPAGHWVEVKSGKTVAAPKHYSVYFTLF
jgi:hypothetical protein